MSIRIKYEKELNQVFEKLIKMCYEVENAIDASMQALSLKDATLAHEVMNNDQKIDNLEREIEQDCLKILLMEHPVASDFRDVSAALKMITDLERIADQASDICEVFLQFSDDEYIKEPTNIIEMANIASKMVKDGVLSYINRDLDLALSLEVRDDIVDGYFETIKKELIELVKEDAKKADQAILLMMIAKYLERIADHAVNLGEWVEYAVTGHHKIG